MRFYQVTFSNYSNDLQVSFHPSESEEYFYQEKAKGKKVLELVDLEKQQQLQLMKGLGLFFPQFEDSRSEFSDIPLPYIFGKGKAQFAQNELGFFPGSFNPWHDGHLECLNRSRLKNVIIVPDFNPWKDNEIVEKNYWNEFKTLADNLKDTPFPLYSGFWGAESKNPTYTWLPLTKVSKRYLVMGADTYMDLLCWKNPIEILTSLKGIRVLGRKIHEDKILKQKKALLEVNPKLDIQIEIINPHEELSSSKMRQRN